MKRLVVCDSRLLLYNLHHRKQSLLDFKKYVKDILHGYKYNKIIYLFDIGKSKKRVKLYPKYKVHRREHDNKLSIVEKNRLKKFNMFYHKLFEYFTEVGGAVGIEGIEADDLANIVCDRFACTEWEILLVSSDSDWCMNFKADNIKMLHVSRNRIISNKHLEKEYKFKNYKDVIRYQIYVGSAKENVTGVKQLGVVRFLKALNSKEGLEDTIEAWLRDGKYGMSLPDGVDSLAELVTRNEEILSPFTYEELTEEEKEKFKEQFNVNKKLSEDDDTLLQLKLFDGLFSI